MNLLQNYPHLKTIQELAKKKKCSVFLVGGFLRDHFVGKKGMDFDFAVNNRAIQLAKGFASKIKGSYVLLDEARGCARVCKKMDGMIATFDFADFRAKTLKGDLKHRDFTINALCVDINRLNEDDCLDDVLIDENKGSNEIRSKTIRMIAPKVFKEDPLRVLRAYSLKAQLGFKIERPTLVQMKKDRLLLRDVSGERVRDEIFKVLAAKTAGKILKEMGKDGILEVVIPQIRVMYNCKQGTYHHLDVWPHSLETVIQLDKLMLELKDSKEIIDYVRESLAGERRRIDLMKLAALLHDIGKPETRLRKDGRISFHGHEHIGKRIVRVIAKMLKLSTKERHVLEDIVRWHLRPGYLSNFKRPSEKAVYRYFRDTKEEAVSTLLVSLADQRSTRGPATSEYDQKHHEKICLGLIQEYLVKKKEKPFHRLIDGHDLIRELKLKPSALFGRILAEVEEKQTLGELTTKKEAIELAQKIAERERHEDQ